MPTRLPSLDLTDLTVETLHKWKNAPRFDEIVPHHPFLFRIWSNKSMSQLTDDGFVASRYSESGVPPPDPTLISLSEEEALEAMEWKPIQSKVVATAFSPAYTLYEAFRRSEVEDNVRIAIISSQALLGRAVTAFEALRAADTSEGKESTEVSRTQTLDNLEQKPIFTSNVAQTVFVKGKIPFESIEAVLSINDLLKFLPPYFKNNEELVFDPKGGSKIRRNNTMWKERLNGEVQKLSDGLVSRNRAEIKLRIESACRLAIAILTLQENSLDPFTPPGYDLFVEKASRLALEFTFFPCDRSDVRWLQRELSPNDVADEVRAQLKEDREGKYFPQLTDDGLEDIPINKLHIDDQALPE